MEKLKSAAAAAALTFATLAGGAASAYPVIVAAPGPVVYAPPPVVYAPPPVVVARPYYPGVYVRPVWVGGVYYRYPYWYRGVRYFGPRPGWGYHYAWGPRWR